ncbi:MAG: GNAT family N-acetyltransferase [Actinomycetota bacterium]
MSQVGEIAALWHAGWTDGHLGHVPDELIEHRQADEFERRTATRIADTTVAVDQATGVVVGFVVVRADEVEQVYVSTSWRGTDVATRLLACAEVPIARHHRVAWLAVVAGNTRARRFYERCGWCDCGDYDNVAEISDGTMIVPSRRYEKSLSAGVEGAAP